MVDDLSCDLLVICPSFQTCTVIILLLKIFKLWQNFAVFFSPSQAIVTSHLVVRGSYHSLSLVIYGNRVEDLGQLNIEFDFDDNALMILLILLRESLKTWQLHCVLLFLLLNIHVLLWVFFLIPIPSYRLLLILFSISFWMIPTCVFVYLATVYGWSNQAPCIEESPLLVANPYGWTKARYD